MAAATTNPPTSTMSDPKDTNAKKSLLSKSEEPVKVEPASQAQPATTEEPSASDAKPATTNAPLGPPPRPSTTGDTPDYFNTVHNTFSVEPNPFEASFGNTSGAAETPGKTIQLPPVANITSPSPLPGGITPGWNSLRAGPLSPAMLTGPTSQTDYFSESFRGFPTPNESSLRTGLTPGGGGSMFPVPSPNTQAIFNLQSGGVTPSTADFQQSALRAAAQANQAKTATSGPTSQPDAVVTAAMDRPNNFPPLQQPQQRRAQHDPYANHDVSNAANDLLSFATQNGGGSRNGQVYATAPQQIHHPVQPVQPINQDHARRGTKGSITSMTGSADAGEFSESGQSEEAKTQTRSRGKKGGANGKQAAGTKRKADEVKGGSRKKSTAPSIDDDDEIMPSDDDHKNEENGGKKMTDEEKRKNFLERNRVAALKCRQRKKQWLANLQAKVELFSTENDALSATVTQLREEIVNLKTLLLAHKECPVSQAQGLQGSNMNTFLGSDLNHANPYGIAQLQPNGVHMGMPMQPSGPMMNRFVFPASRRPGPYGQENAPYPSKQALEQ